MTILDIMTNRATEVTADLERIGRWVLGSLDAFVGYRWIALFHQSNKDQHY
jgi:hypothetical protein